MRTVGPLLPLFLLACSSSSAPAPATSDAATDGAIADTGAAESTVDAPKATEPAVVVWGGSALEATCANPRLLENVLGALGHRKPKLKIFHPTWDGCDPRKDPKVCGVASSLATLAPVFEAFDRLGTVDFGKVVDDLSSFDVVVADFCNADLALHHAALTKFVDAGGGLLVLGNHACLPGDDATTSAELANPFLDRYGIQFSPIDSKVPGCEAVPASARTGLLAGVESFAGQRLPTLVVAAKVTGLLPDGGGNPRLAVVFREVR